MPLIFQKIIKRVDLKANPKCIYVFGDNVMRVGEGGQAGEMRGEPNAFGVATKWAPGMHDGDFFRDDNPKCWNYVETDLGDIESALINGEIVIAPLDGIGTGLARLPELAPQLHDFIEKWLRARKMG